MSATLEGMFGVEILISFNFPNFKLTSATLSIQILKTEFAKPQAKV